MDDSLQDEIIDGRKYLLLFDDSDRFKDEIKPLLSFVKHNNKNNSIKVILSLRTSGLQAIHEIIKELRCEELSDEINISNWSNIDLIQLLRLAVEQQKVEDEGRIVKAYPNPYLIVWIGKKIKNEPTLEFGKIKEKFVNEIDYEAEQCLKDFLSASEVKDFLTNLACIIPFSKENATVLGVLSSQFNLNQDKLRKALEILEKVGILRIVGRSLRFNPDMKGDLYLAYMVTTDTKMLERLIFIWQSVPVSWDSFEGIFINLDAAARYSDSTAFRNTLSKIVDSWIEKATSATGFERKNKLTQATKIANTVPENCLNLLAVYLESSAPLSNDTTLTALGCEDITLTSDDYGPLIIKLIRIPNIRREIIDTLEKMEVKTIGRYHNYNPTSLIKEAVSPLKNNYNIINNTLDIFQDWLNKPNKSKINLISSALSELLAGSHEYSNYANGTVTWGRKVLSDISEVRQIRDKSILILKNMISHPLIDAKLAGVQVSEEIGTILGKTSEKNLPLSNKFATERAEIADEIEHLISPEADFKLLNAIENLFLKWWAQEIEGTEKVKGYLHKFPRRSEYIVYRYFVSPDFVVEEFDSVEKQAPEKDKWKWFVHNFMNKYIDLKPEDFRILVEIQNEKYNTEDKLINYLIDLDLQLSDGDSYHQPPIITCWVRINPELFLSVRKNCKLWEMIPLRFKKEINLAICEMDEEFVTKLAEEVLNKLPDALISEIETFILLLERHPIEKSTLDSWLTELLEKGSSDARASVVSHLSFISEKIEDFNFGIRLLFFALSKETEIDAKMISSLFIFTNHIQNHTGSIDEKLVDDLRVKCIEKLKDAPEINFEVQKILDFAFNGIDSVIDFIEYRLRKLGENRKKSVEEQRYQAFPYEGINFIIHQIKSYNDYAKLIERVIYDYKDRVLELKSLLKPIASLLSDTTGKLYIEEYIEKQIQACNIKNALIASYFLPFNENTINIFIDIAEKAIASGQSRDIEGLFNYKKYPEEGTTSLPGEPPPELITRKNLFQKMYEKTKPGKLKMLVGRCIESICGDIEGHMKLDEEFLDPKE